MYRVVVIALLAAVTYAFTGNAGETTLITIVFNAAGSVVYYGFERLWDSIRWGKRGAAPMDPVEADQPFGQPSYLQGNPPGKWPQRDRSSQPSSS